MKRDILVRLPFAIVATLVCAACSWGELVLPASIGIAEKREAWLSTDAQRVLVVAHRGCWQDTSENSIEAIHACSALGVDVIEIDVRRTSDGVLVLMHDETIDRTTDGLGKVEELTLKEIRALRLRRGAGGPDAGVTETRVPTFEEAMLAAKGEMLINLDAKADVYDDAFAVLERLDLVDHIIMKRRVTVGEAPLLLAPPFDRVLSMPIIDEAAGSAEALLESQTTAPPTAVEVIFTDIAYLESAGPLIAEMGARVWVNTLRPQFSAGLVDELALHNPDRVWGRLIDRGVDTIQTDEPEALIQYLRSRNLR